ncbi:PTS mannose/fructose/sorbose/N-acetylgalactosamine transporter subunit IIC [Enterococcus raffinosus]|uniref:PTS sugar transporter subunit IIC n=1 Tax=Enterococcus raffinosus TaxID=71452 RepID=A0AAW8TAK6_9ENTE|nr:PTS sugar transporter subunit IIC [Enterococcus raffinosus]MDT2523743.1 PTS sugar transporter subunit IIC [Enterococcus raffinosus]MDT2529712.1 PTS sugar transporter subunit IIC [Enterococcus raffinosus]MDT2534276.1 PTS sugar transporter subunit IIC [Enterococcus raffinosus]MDT2544880.1 PTS sugar transporter subunit IIC [Enterococcus raffinosus]MDT2556826.1 PTS sugar transporter subunit IIC [Enterococcus raffinosus]
MHLSLAIILVLCLYTAIGVLDQISIQIGPYTPLFAAVFTGLVMGDLKTGLMIGATLQLMTLGVATYGGATVPDFLSGAIMGTAYAILSGKGVEYGIGVAVPIGLLLTQLDILGRMANTFVQHRADRFAEEGNYRGVDLCNVLGILPWTLSRVIPVFIGLYFGEQVVKLINEMIPAWIMTGLKASGAILPAMGIAILMRYLPIKKYWPYFLVGFVLLAFGAEFFSVLGVALVGLALAAMYVMNHNNPTPAATITGAVYEDDEEIEIDD